MNTPLASASTEGQFVKNAIFFGLWIVAI